MKKIIVALLSIILCFGLVACGDGGDNKTSETETPKVEKTVTAIAEAMGFTDEPQEKAFEMVGATDGAGYGDYEIYIYDENSDAYDQITGDGYDMGLAVMTATASNNGVVLIYVGDGKADQTTIDNFNGLNIK